MIIIVFDNGRKDHIDTAFEGVKKKNKKKNEKKVSTAKKLYRSTCLVCLPCKNIPIFFTYGSYI